MLRTTFFVISVIGLAACGNSATGADELDSDGDGFPDLADACPDEPETVNGVFDTDGCPDTPQRFYDVVLLDVEEWWTELLTGQPFPYRPISEFVAYTTPVDTPCGVVESNSASYCIASEGVYYDSNFLQFFLDEVGDLAPAFIIAHEIGHHASNIFGFEAPSVITVKELELQADCFGGAWVASAGSRGLLQPSAQGETLDAFLLAGDPASTWFRPDLHGTADERTTAFVVGTVNGTPSCTSPDFFALFSPPSE